MDTTQQIEFFNCSKKPHKTEIKQNFKLIMVKNKPQMSISDSLCITLSDESFSESKM